MCYICNMRRSDLPDMYTRGCAAPESECGTWIGQACNGIARVLSHPIQDLNHQMNSFLYYA